jgi:hypothetical protein
MTVEQNLEEIFDVNATPKVPVVQKQTSVVEHVDEDKLARDLDVDYAKVRDNYEEIIEKGKDAIDEILQIAKLSQHPRAFEVAATMIKNVTEANEKLITLQKQVRDLDKSKEKSSTKIDKAIFVGSTAELNKMLKGD